LQLDVQQWRKGLTAAYHGWHEEAVNPADGASGDNRVKVVLFLADHGDGLVFFEDARGSIQLIAVRHVLDRSHCVVQDVATLCFFDVNSLVISWCRSDELSVVDTAWRPSRN
jgi:hypothetical protein